MAETDLSYSLLCSENVFGNLWVELLTVLDHRTSNCWIKVFHFIVYEAQAFCIRTEEIWTFSWLNVDFFSGSCQIPQILQCGADLQNNLWADSSEDIGIPRQQCNFDDWVGLQNSVQIRTCRVCLCGISEELGPFFNVGVDIRSFLCKKLDFQSLYLWNFLCSKSEEGWEIFFQRVRVRFWNGHTEFVDWAEY